MRLYKKNINEERPDIVTWMVYNNNKYRGADTLEELLYRLGAGMFGGGNEDNLIQTGYFDLIGEYESIDEMKQNLNLEFPEEFI